MRTVVSKQFYGNKSIINLPKTTTKVPSLEVLRLRYIDSKELQHISR